MMDKCPKYGDPGQAPYMDHEPDQDKAVTEHEWWMNSYLLIVNSGRIGYFSWE